MKEDWQQIALCDVCDFQGGSQPPKSTFVSKPKPGYVRLLQIRDFKSDDKAVYIAENQAKKRCKDEDIMIGRYGASVGQIHRGKSGAYNVALMKTIPDITRLDRDYLYFYLLSPLFQDSLSTVAARSAQAGFSKSDIKDFPLPLPPLPEQKRIVAILDEAFAGIATAVANTEKNLANARELFESQLHSEHADKALLGGLVNIKTGKLDANAAVEGGQYPFFTCSRDISAINTYAFDCEAILLAGNNAVGDFNVKHYKGKFNAYQRTYVITVNEKKRLLHRFLYFQILKGLKKFKTQSVGAGTKFLKLGMIKDLEITVPSLDEQQRIVSRIDSVREETQRLESLYHQKLTTLAELKQSLLHKAFSGELTAQPERALQEAVA